MQNDFGINQSLVEEFYARYQDNPTAVPKAWRAFFDRLSPELTGSLQQRIKARAGSIAPPAPNGTHGSATASNGNGSHASDHARRVSSEVLAAYAPLAGAIGAGLELQARVSALINAYRRDGHLSANIDPLGLLDRGADALRLERFGLSETDLTTVFDVGDMPGPSKLPLREIQRKLENTYCASIGVEFMDIPDPSERRWLLERMELSQNRTELRPEERVRLLQNLSDAEVFEQFIHTNYVGAKRFSLEGGESLIAALEVAIARGSERGVTDVVMGMAHRGRLNVLVNVMRKNPADILAGFEDLHPELNLGRGDVKYHLGYQSERDMPGGQRVRLSLAFNPSHLEYVNPVVEGRVRAIQDCQGDPERSRVLPILIHGDAAFIAQGVVAETLNLSELEGYATGGTLHIVVNNQVGFTTSTDDARSTRYATDITRMLRVPVFHVNGDDPEAVAHVMQLAMDYRQEFGRDVVVDLVCYRRYGHNEADEPRFTQPVMYTAIDARPSIRTLYAAKLAESGALASAAAEAMVSEKRQSLEAALATARRKDYVPGHTQPGVWANYRGGADEATPDVATGAGDSKLLRELLVKASQAPADFAIHPKVERLFEQRRQRAEKDQPLDWGSAEILAYASLVNAGVRVRLSGEDCRRGTFSHRHAGVYDTKNGKLFVPLAQIAAEHGGAFEVYDSALSEAGVLGFDYGYSLQMPQGLVLWEAQFGDFVNCAQVAIDQFISSSEYKWNRLSGIVLLLPHGFEGQGPEHSSARLERFLTLCAQDNMQVCNLTTPAQLFHCLRRQVLRPYRKPLIIMTPKSLLRHPKVTSSFDELASGTFQRIIPDTRGKDLSGVRRVLLCSGKVYYDLDAERESRGIKDVAIVRLEQLYPIRAAELNEVLAQYPKNAELVWVQEEPLNMGAWYFLNAHFANWVTGRTLKAVGRAASASPATGSLASHKLEQSRLLEQALT